eukprot:CAMPEP_0180640862 /NCGR_PEP_ID=MMETSP1037_2-20121125/46116_1 /TAXON_ID=632150 /ORGANISM="Azadinium spinosum, Strain 3D9" /LENGTH=125 /DNA_ID=CAMNT_0022663549 /DNA_START=19 /DNA_END=396 /DNA_ORIENTATION=-
MENLTCGVCCGCKECADDKCNCRCGEATFFVGVVIFVAAVAFWAFGLVLALLIEHEFWYPRFHEMNIDFFYLAFMVMPVGIAYAFWARGKAAFSREPPEVPEEADAATTSAEGEVRAPTPYVMIA